MKAPSMQTLDIGSGSNRGVATASGVKVVDARIRYMRRKRRKLLHRILVYIPLVVGGVVFALPFYWMVITALKPANDVFTSPPSFFPRVIEPLNFVYGWTAFPFTRFLLNSVLVTFLAVLGNLVSCTLAAYGFARLKARGRQMLFAIMLATLMIPQEVTIVPTFILFSKIHMVNTLFPLFLPAWFGYPFFIFLLRQFFMSIPTELSDAARVDGASHFRVFAQIVLPLAKPALGAVTIFSFVANWNNYIGPLIYLRSVSLYTLPLGLGLFQSQNFTLYSLLMAVSLITLAPMIVVFFLAQRYFVEGVTITGIAGR